MSSPKESVNNKLPINPDSPDVLSAAQQSAPAHRPAPRPKRSNLDQEPNPFEQSFARPPTNPTSSLRSSVRHQDSNDSQPAQPDSAEAQQRPRSTESSGSRKSNGSPKPTLPPLASINSPSDQYPWSSTLANSLRSGPLSPAMLAGPAQSNGEPGLAFDPANFRTGLTPRSGLTPGTGLTPLLGGPVAFPPPSPGTAAILSMMNNAAAGTGPTITPNTLNAITGVLSTTAANASAAAASQGPHPLSVSHVPYDRANGALPNGQENYPQSAAAATTSAANGLFLLSQAHQELTKREEAQRAGQQAQQHLSPPMQSATVTNGRRGTKRKQTQEEANSPPANKPAPAKRTRQSTQSLPTNRPRQQTPSVDDDEEEEEEEEMLSADMPAAGGKKGQQKKFETEEEKRKNFLERNRQAALKCRQRKKAWLAQLQAKVEFLTQENERLQAALVSAREEIARLSAAAVIPVQGANHAGAPAPVSVNVALPQGQKVAAGGRGYGY